MKVFILASIKDGGEIRGVFLSHSAAMNNLGYTQRGAGFAITEHELVVDKLTNKYQDFILTILAIAKSEGLPLQSPTERPT